jgi:selenocysteine-specific elongation factor
VPHRDTAGPLLFSIDHCFAIKGQGTVMTGTVLSGSVSVNDVRPAGSACAFLCTHGQQTLEIPELRVQRKVKSMQMFRRPVVRAVQGDRVGVCVAQMDAAALERGLACAPGAVPTFGAAIARVQRVRFFKRPLRSKDRLHGAFLAASLESAPLIVMQ